MIRGSFLLLGALLLPAPAATQVFPASAPAARPAVRAVPLDPDDTIVLDGRLDEPAWSRAPVATGFRQRDPVTGAPATERTEVRILYDRERLLIGVVCFDSDPSGILGNQMQRDASFGADDRFMWALDPFLNERTGYFFEINPSGAMGDGLITLAQGGASVNKSWDGIWHARVRRSEIGWTAEIAIPFQTLNFDRDAAAWGINFQRTIRRKNEEVLWTGYERNQGLNRLSNAGLLLGLSGISQGLGLDLRPYVLGGTLQEPGAGRPALRGDGDAGLDVFYSLTPALRANLTVNTDFAETEVDQRRVNLSRFPISFPERRDFFLEGASVFDFAPSQVEPFFSRRIGLDASGRPQGIDFGTKLTGQAGAFDLGVLQVRTREERNAPGEDFIVVRTRRRVLAQSYVGALYTRRGTRGAAGPGLHTAGIDFGLETTRFRGNRNLAFAGFYVRNSTPDGGPGAAYGFRLNFPNEPLSARVSYRELQAAYRPAVGFTPRNDIRRLNPNVQFTSRPDGHRWVRSLSFDGSLDLTATTQNDVVTRRFTFTLLQADLHSGDSLRIQLTPAFERMERDFRIHDGIVLPQGRTYEFVRYALRLDTASHRVLALRTDYEAGSFLSGNRRELGTGLSLRPRAGVLVGLDGEWNHVNLAEGRFSTRLFRASANTQFNPWISLANNLQYDTISKVLGWQLRLRWIARPGDDLYVVYQHNWVDRGGLSTFDRRSAVKVARTLRF